ncbi:MAG: flagellar biosynthetic protein FliO [Lachnospiraceae bacterium]|uniref:flagellar biosynthetic protein FliO n=1 Tax=Roseburia hominis TaxID=301301 RepID=UPI001F2D29CD|nr:flagellar biosynthetic protein FliO [Roseburia hominis]MDD6169999.1 flagellar biosynthetic protein FliO [Lachnospiraceae bacterium]MDY4840372.1 flagellar biosynthetic protein FliO [Lachnospiraceae bacterium]
MLLAGVSSGVESFVQLLGILVVFILVLVLTYFTTKWIASYQKGHSYNKNLQVIETLKLTTNKYIQIIEAGDIYLVVAIGKDEVTFLTQLTKDQLKEGTFDDVTTASKQTGENFGEILNKFKGHLPKK